MKRLYLLLPLLLVSLLAACAGADLDAPPEILYGADVCDRCNMIISEARFAAAYVTDAGDVRRFDDIGGMFAYDAEHGEDVHAFWVHDYDSAAWLRADEAAFVVSERINSPMAFGIAAFESQAAADSFAAEENGALLDFEALRAHIAADRGSGAMAGHPQGMGNGAMGDN